MGQIIVLTGRLGGDPEIKYLANDRVVCNFSLADNRKWTGANGEPQEQVSWFRIQSWGKQAESCAEYLKKGSYCRVDGRLIVDGKTGGPRIWVGNDGEARANHEVRANVVEFGPAGNGGGNGSQFNDAASAQEEDEIPF